MEPSDSVFGTDPKPEPKQLTYRDVADYLNEMQPRALSLDEADDALQLLEYMHEQTMAIINKQREQAAELSAREAHLTQREALLALKERAVAVVMKTAPPQKRRYFWSK